MLFVVTGLGASTGTGAAPVIARIARGMGILTVGLATKPFQFEDDHRQTIAEEGLVEFAASVDSLIVAPNRALFEHSEGRLTQDEAFSRANQMLHDAVSGISEVIHVPGLVNVDFEDIKTVMSEAGRATIGAGRAAGTDRARIAAEKAVSFPVLEGVDLSAARGLLVLIAASRSTFKLSESKLAMNTIRRHAAEEAHVIFGTAYDERLGDELRVTVIATGLSESSRHIEPATSPEPRKMDEYGRVGSRRFWRFRNQTAPRAELGESRGMDEIEIPAFLRKKED